MSPQLRRLERLRADHARAIYAFEQDNRAYFATSISDRGDEFFAEFAARYSALLAEQEGGTNAYYVLIDDDGGDVVGRFNLYDFVDGVATVGYRVAQHVTGQGVATAAVRELCTTASSLGVHALVAATSHENVASQRVLTKAGFVREGPADPSELGGKLGSRYRRDLVGR